LDTLIDRPITSTLRPLKPSSSGSRPNFDYIKHDALRFAARSVDFGNARRQRFGAACCQRNVGTVLGEETREMSTEGRWSRR
jgi:hypothetical protein